MSCATRIEAVYDAFAQQPDNPQVLETLAAGISGITVLDPRSTDDVLRYFKDCAPYPSWALGPCDQA
eukprot:5261163-Pyramimonas_sp.AAC.1